jgi:NAD(P)-dependent dehydrogenase (short-subunit alcohol dehydrogenase family)
MGAIVTGFGFASTAADVAEGADLGGRRAVVTGGASPLGTETARELARAGAAVTLTVRDLPAVGASIRWADDGITANAVGPGLIDARCTSHGPGGLFVPPGLRKTPQQAAATAVLLAVSPLLEAVGGRYFSDCNEAEPVSQRPVGYPQILRSVARYALDPGNADRLWDTSVRLLS